MLNKQHCKERLSQALNELELINIILAKSERIGADKDYPEGARYIQISETLVNKMIETIEEILVNKC